MDPQWGDRHAGARRKRAQRDRWVVLMAGREYERRKRNMGRMGRGEEGKGGGGEGGGRVMEFI